MVTKNAHNSVYCVHQQREVLRELQKEWEILEIVKKRKIEWCGHLFRGPRYKMAQTVMKGEIEGKRRIGPERLSWLRNLRHLTEKNFKELFRLAGDREALNEMV